MDLKMALKQLAWQIEREIIKRMSSDVGINERIGKNTLIGSDLYKSVSVDVVSDNELVFAIASHYEYVVKGRKRGWKNHPPKPPGIVYGITQWVRKKGIRFQGMTENGTIWCVLNALEKRDIKARPFINFDEHGDPSVILPFLDDFFSKWADEVFEEIMKEVDKYFSN